jgi:ribosomal protein S4
MVNLLQFRHKSCKKYSNDLWGQVLSKGKYDKLGKYLCNEYRKPSRQRRRSKSYKELMEDQKKVRLFYGGVKMVAYKRYQSAGSLIAHLECRLAMVAYRLNFTSTIGEAMDYVKRGYFLLNNEVITHPNCPVKVGDVVQVAPIYRDKLYRDLNMRLRSRYYPLPYGKYLEVNYQIMAGILLYEPVFEDVYFPFPVSKIALGRHYI